MSKYKYSLTDTDMKAIIHVFRIFEIRLRSGVMREGVQEDRKCFPYQYILIWLICMKTILESDGCNEYART